MKGEISKDMDPKWSHEGGTMSGSEAVAIFAYDSSRYRHRAARPL